jgi:hypothetical protein
MTICIKIGKTKHSIDEKHIANSLLLSNIYEDVGEHITLKVPNNGIEWSDCMSNYIDMLDGGEINYDAKTTLEMMLFLDYIIDQINLDKVVCHFSDIIDGLEVTELEKLLGAKINAEKVNKNMQKLKKYRMSNHNM